MPVSMPGSLAARIAGRRGPSPAAPAAGRKVYAGRKVQAGTLFLTVALFKRTEVFCHWEPWQIFFRELEFYRTKYAFQLYAYVLMPDHFHLLLNFLPEKRFADFLRDFKSAIGRLIVDWAKRDNQCRLLRRWRQGKAPRRRKDSRYCVLQPNSYVRPVTSSSIFAQKLDYIHANPVREQLVERAIDYPYSSLRNYELGRGAIRIDPS